MRAGERTEFILEEAGSPRHRVNTGGPVLFPCIWGWKRARKCSAGPPLRVPGDALCFDQIVADGVADQFGQRVDTELAHDVGPVGLDGLEADPQGPGDLLVAP